MTFAAPLFLLAALAGLIPVLVHLIHRQKAREVRFSTLRFLRISVQRTRRRKYVEDLSLLAVRVAVLLLIAAGAGAPRDLQPGVALGAGADRGDRDRARQLGQHGRDRWRASPVRDRPAGGRAGARPAPRGRPGGPAAHRRTSRPGARAALSHARDRAPGDRPVPAQLRTGRPCRQDPAGPRPAGPVRRPQQGDLRLHRQPEPLVGRPEGAGRGRGPQEAEPERPRRPSSW